MNANRGSFPSAIGSALPSFFAFNDIRPETERNVNLKVRQITYDQAKPFILGIHYARRMPCIQYAFGLFDGDRIIGVVTYGQPASPNLCVGIAGSENKKNVLELNRLVLLPEDNGKNNASFLVGRSLKKLPRGLYIVSYADAGGWGHVGYVYQATNFIYTGMTKRRTDTYSKTGHSRHNCGDKSIRQIRTEKHRYVYLTGDKRKQIKSLRYPILPYPKGDSKKYDIENPHGILSERDVICVKGSKGECNG